MAGIPSVFTGDVQFNGMVSFPGGMNLPNGVVANAQIPPLAAIDASKLQHLLQQACSQASDANAAAETRVVKVAKAAGILQGFKAGAVVPAIGAATATVDLKKNGTTVLTAPISLTSAQSARQLVAGVLSATAYSAGDVFEWVVTATAGGGTLAQGVFASLDCFEAAQ